MDKTTDTTIDQMYDIAMAFITDQGTILAHYDIYGAHIYDIHKHGLTKYPYTLSVKIPQCEPGSGTPILDIFSHNPGKISLCRGLDSGWYDQRLLMRAKTRLNVGLATRCKFNRAIGCLLAPKYFELVNAIEQRKNNKLELRDNTEIITKLIQKYPSR